MKSIAKVWKNVGVHPTPERLVEIFVQRVVSSFNVSPLPIVRILDACAGDGRLGLGVARRLEELGVEYTLHLVDTRYATDEISSCGRVQRISASIFSFCSDPYDIVVSNPPYESIGVERARELGLPWVDVKSGARNLYGMVIERCLDLSAQGGICAFIAPHGWLRNVNSLVLRTKIYKSVDQVQVFAFASRRLFPGVVQDTSIQVFGRRSDDCDGQCKVVISYDGDEAEFEINDVRVRPTMIALPRVRVGPLVWNRHTPGALGSRGYSVVYGGTVRPDGRLDWRCEKYKNRRKVLISSVPRDFVSAGPFIAIRRTMRGVPGRWLVDCALETSRETRCVAENHVIMIEFSLEATEHEVNRIFSEIRTKVEHAHRHHGHPNVSVKLVKQAVESIGFS